MSTCVNYRGVGGQNRAKNGQRSLRMTPNVIVDMYHTMDDKKANTFVPDKHPMMSCWLCATTTNTVGYKVFHIEMQVIKGLINIKYCLKLSEQDNRTSTGCRHL